MKTGSKRVPFHLVNIFVTGKEEKNRVKLPQVNVLNFHILRQIWIWLLTEQAKTKAFILCSLKHFEPTLAEVTAENKTESPVLLFHAPRTSPPFVPKMQQKVNIFFFNQAAGTGQFRTDGFCGSSGLFWFGVHAVRASVTPT